MKTFFAPSARSRSGVNVSTVIGIGRTGVEFAVTGDAGELDALGFDDAFAASAEPVSIGGDAGVCFSEGFGSGDGGGWAGKLEGTATADGAVAAALFSFAALVACSAGETVLGVGVEAGGIACVFLSVGCNVALGSTTTDWRLEPCSTRSIPAPTATAPVTAPTISRLRTLCRGPGASNVYPETEPGDRSTTGSAA